MRVVRIDSPFRHASPYPDLHHGQFSRRLIVPVVVCGSLPRSSATPRRAVLRRACRHAAPRVREQGDDAVHPDSAASSARVANIERTTMGIKSSKSSKTAAAAAAATTGCAGQPSVADHVALGRGVVEMRKWGVPAKDLLDYGFSPEDLAAGPEPYSCDQLLQSRSSKVNQVVLLSLYHAADVRRAYASFPGESGEEPLTARRVQGSLSVFNKETCGFEVSELKQEGFSAQEVIDMGFALIDMIDSYPSAELPTPESRLHVCISYGEVTADGATTPDSLERLVFCQNECCAKPTRCIAVDVERKPQRAAVWGYVYDPVESDQYAVGNMLACEDCGCCPHCRPAGCTG